MRPIASYDGQMVHQPEAGLLVGQTRSTVGTKSRSVSVPMPVRTRY
jgi:hypothetical protein